MTHAFTATIPVEENTVPPPSDGEQLREVTLSKQSEKIGGTTTIDGPFPLAVDGFRWHFFSTQRSRFVEFCRRQPRQSVEIIGITDTDRRLCGFVETVSVDDDGVVVYVMPPQ